jgi:hypothetical protein
MKFRTKRGVKPFMAYGHKFNKDWTEVESESLVTKFQKYPQLEAEGAEFPDLKPARKKKAQ